MVSLQDVPLHSKYEAISVNSEIEEIVSTLLEQNFVPVVDDSGVFIGIIRRREVMQWLSKQNGNAMIQETD
ncbi:CBS domain-containing protein [Bacillales bacterium AN1005]